MSPMHSCEEYCAFGRAFGTERNCCRKMPPRPCIRSSVDAVAGVASGMCTASCSDRSICANAGSAGASALGAPGGRAAVGVKSATHFFCLAKVVYYKNEPTAPRDYLASTLHDIHTRPLACYVSERYSQCTCGAPWQCHCPCARRWQRTCHGAPAMHRSQPPITSPCISTPPPCDSRPPHSEPSHAPETVLSPGSGRAASGAGLLDEFLDRGQRVG